MIRTTALTLICLAGLGAIAGAAIKSTPPLPEIVRPVVAGNKADRLPLVVNEDPLKAAEKIDTAYVQPVGEVQSSPPAETPPVATPAASDPKPSKVDAPRRAKATTASKQNVSRSKRVAAADRSPKEVSAPAATPDSASPSNQTSALKECSGSIRFCESSTWLRRAVDALTDGVKRALWKFSQRSLIEEGAAPSPAASCFAFMTARCS